MLDAKQAKASKVKKSKKTMEEEQPKVKSVEEVPLKRIEPTSTTPASRMEENTSPSMALEKALQRIEQQARGL